MVGGMPRVLNEEANVTDYLLGLDDLQQPRAIDMSIIRPNEWNSAILFIARLILMRKGQLDDHPDMGIDIRARYKFSYEDELIQLNQEIQEQVARFLPEFSPIEVTSQFKEGKAEGSIVIIVIIDNVAYELLYSLTSATIEGLEGMG